MKKNNGFIGSYLLFLLWFPSLVVVAAIDDDVNNMLLNTADLNAGQQVFETACAACHNKNLSGATGFNLKDGEWIHGDKPSDIVKNIQQGFAKGGMPGFAAIYSEQQIKQVSAYILSKREGWDQLIYKIYALDSDTKKLSLSLLDGKTPLKAGKIANNMADFLLPEIRDYALIFEGDFYQPHALAEKIETSFPPSILVAVELNGQPLQNFKNRIPVHQGKHKLKITLMSTYNLLRNKDRGKGKTNLSLLVTGKGKRKFFGASTRGLAAMNANQLNVKVDKQPLVQRKRVLDLAPFSIAVGLTEKMNYAFNPKDCSISGVWSGELLNIGPNVKHRGSDNSLILGDWIFHAPDGITPEANHCRFNKYNRLGNPSFYFTLDDVEFKLNGQVNTNKELELHYQVLSNPHNSKQLRLSLPANKKAKITSQQANVTEQSLTFDLEKHSRFSVQISAAEGAK